MKNEEINRLLAEFMGFEHYAPNDYLIDIPLVDAKIYSVGNMEFCISLDWLMPVLDKIEEAGFNTEINCTHGIKEKLYFVGLTNLSGSPRTFTGVGPDRLMAILAAIIDYIDKLNLKP